MTSKRTKSEDLYKECLKEILSFYDTQVDLEGLISSVPKSGDVLQHQDLALICKKLNFNFQSLKMDFRKIGGLKQPAVLLMEDGPCIYYPDSMTQGRFVFPGRQGKAVSVKEMARAYKGQVLILSPKNNKGGLDTSHIKHGHALDWFWQPISSFWPQYIEIIVCSLFINLLVLAVPLFTLNVYDRVVINFSESTLIVLTAGVMIALMFDFFFKLTRSYILERVAAKISVQHDYDLMERMFHIKDVDMSLSSGEKFRIFHELSSIRDFYASRLIPTLVDAPFFFLFLLVIYYLAGSLVYVPITAAVIIILLNLAAQVPINRATQQKFESMQDKSSILLELLNGSSIIKMLDASGYKLLQWRLAAQGSSDTLLHNNITVSVVTNLTATITRIAYASVIFFGAFQIEAGNLTVGGLIACSIIFSTAMTPVASFSGIISRLRQSKDILQTIDKIFQLPHGDIQGRNKGSKGPFRGDISLENLSYQYPGQARPALDSINLKIRAGEHVGIIGQTGAGKTTLSRVIANLLCPTEGRAFIDDLVYDAISETELYRTIGYVPQDSYFFNGSIRENILLGKRYENGEQALANAVEMSGLNLVMSQTNEGLDMDVGEGGKRLSGGQKQAISLARAFIRDPKIIVFDEPTTGMDSGLEAKVKESLATYIKDKTFIIITHRSSLLPLVNRLILIDRGRIAADGPRDEILKKLSGR